MSRVCLLAYCDLWALCGLALGDPKAPCGHTNDKSILDVDSPSVQKKIVAELKDDCKIYLKSFVLL
jgi:hypothetical protein